MIDLTEFRVIKSVPRSPYIALSVNGLLISRGAIDLYDLSIYKSVKLFYNDSKKIIAFKFFESEKSDAYKLKSDANGKRVPNMRRIIPCLPFLKTVGIDPGSRIKYPLNWDSETRMYYIDLKSYFRRYYEC